MKSARPLVAVTALLAAFAWAQPVLADDLGDAAQLAPADTNVLIRVSDFNEHRAAWGEDPLVRYAWDRMTGGQNLQPWLFVQALLNLTGDQILNTYFDGEVTLVGERPGDNEPAVVFSQARPSDSQYVAGQLNLIEMADQNGFRVYRSEDDTFRFGYSDDRFLLAGVHAHRWLMRVVEAMGEGDSLADDAEFRGWADRLPADADAAAFVRKPSDGEVHAAALRLTDRRATLTYAGQSPKAAQLDGKLGGQTAVRMPALPGSVIAAMAINVQRPGNARALRMMDRFTQPASFENDILPRLDAPAAMFLSERQRDGQPPLPVIGIALPMNDAAVAADLTRMMDNLMLLANIATMKWETDPVTLSNRTHAGQTYHVADVGAPLAQRSGRDVLNGVELAYGAAGDWYIITTAGDTLGELIDASSGGRASGLAEKLSMQGRPGHTPVGTMAVNFPRLRDHAAAWVKHWQTHQPALYDAEPTTPEGKLAHAAREWVKATPSLRDGQMHLWHHNGNQLRAEATVTRDPSGNGP